MSAETVAVIGLGYVGLPLAAAFGRVRDTIGFDVDSVRVEELRGGFDRTLECSSEEILGAGRLRFTALPHDLAEAGVFVVAVPTPIDAAKRPNLGPLRSASRIVGEVLKPGDLVVYESTVYPGATEEECVPILEELSGLRCNTDFAVGYSPERVNPGDKEHRLEDIVKVTSGSNPEAAERVDALYRSVISAGTHRASSIRVAEAAKVIENTQRDVNIALVNELAILFNELDIDTHEVLAAAASKWNFLKFEPGLVGGHCIGVDPYYLTHKAQEVGYHPEVIRAGRRINDGMGAYVADQLVLRMARGGMNVGASRVLVLGLAFKENCPDLRNTRVVDLVNRLEAYGIGTDVVDPWVDPEAAREEYGIQVSTMEQLSHEVYAGVILAVAHAQFMETASSIREYLQPGGVVYDVKSFWPQEVVDARL